MQLNLMRLILIQSILLLDSWLYCLQLMELPMSGYTFDTTKNLYQQEWSGMTVTRESVALYQAKQIASGKDRYNAISQIVRVPWFVLGITHCREAGMPPQWNACLQNGEKIIGTGRKTKLVPINQGPFPTFEDSVKAAVKTDDLDQINFEDGFGPEHCAFFWEAFNGWGYRAHGIPSPYDWAGTSVQKPGKYTADGKYDSSVMDTQIGGMALLYELMRIDSSVVFTVPSAVQAPAPKSPAPTVSSENWLSSLIDQGEQEFNDMYNDIGGILAKGKAL